MIGIQSCKHYKMFWQVSTADIACTMLTAWKWFHHNSSVSAWLTWSKSCFHRGNRLTQRRFSVTTWPSHFQPSAASQNSTAMSSRPWGLLPNSIGSLSGSHNKVDAGKSGMDAQQLLESVVDNTPTVVQLLTQVFLPCLYFLSLLILTCI